MSRTILIYGQSGAGKTTSCRNLDPDHTYYVDCDGKGLSWQGWRKQYNRDKHNYFRTDIVSPTHPCSVQAIVGKVATSDQCKHINVIVVDGITTLMVTDEFRRRNEKGFDKYQDLAACIFNLCKEAVTYRDDLTVVFIGHVDVDRDQNSSEVFAQVKTSGQKLKKIVLESLFTTVLYAKADGEHHFFETRAGNSTAKSPINALPPEVDNDISEVIKLLIKYEEE